MIPPYDAYGGANSEDPDQTAPLVASDMICTVDPNQSVQKFRNITVSHIINKPVLMFSDLVVLKPVHATTKMEDIFLVMDARDIIPDDQWSCERSPDILA